MNGLWTIYCTKSIFNSITEFNNLLEIIQNHTTIKMHETAT